MTLLFFSVFGSCKKDLKRQKAKRLLAKYPICVDQEITGERLKERKRGGTVRYWEALGVSDGPFAVDKVVSDAHGDTETHRNMRTHTFIP